MGSEGKRSANGVNRGARLRSAPASATMESMSGLLEMAVEAGDEEGLAALVERGARPSAAASSRHVPFHVAAANGFTGCLGILLERFPDMVDERDARGATASMVAAGFGKEAALGLLAAAGADPTAKNHAKSTLLHHAAGTADEGVWRLAVDLSADCLGAVDGHGMTALHCAAAYGAAGLVEMLLEAGLGGMAGERDVDGDTALDLAAEAGLAPWAVSLLAAATPKEVRERTLERVDRLCAADYRTAFKAALDEVELATEVPSSSEGRVGRPGL